MCGFSREGQKNKDFQGEWVVVYTLEKFCADARNALKADAGPAGHDAILAKLEQLLKEDSFLAECCGPDAKPGIKTIYRCPETGFNVLVHIYEKGKSGPPHDHGTSWAIYGQAEGNTTMTVWKRKDDRSDDAHADIEEYKSFELGPGMAGKFEVGEIHSIKISDGSKFVRVTGTDLNTIDTGVYNPQDHTVTSGNRL
jgi:predicted metal-dependent enzyme (double-stranded beta helix superfamily)